MYVAADAGLNLRAESARTGNPITLLPFCARVEVTETGNQWEDIDGVRAPWVRVRYKTFTGWVFEGYLSENELTNAKYGKARTMYVIANQGLPVIIIPNEKSRDIGGEDILPYTNCWMTSGLQS